MSVPSTITKAKLGTKYILTCRKGIIQHDCGWKKFDDAGTHSVSGNMSGPNSFDAASDP